MKQNNTKRKETILNERKQKATKGNKTKKKLIEDLNYK